MDPNTAQFLTDDRRHRSKVGPIQDAWQRMVEGRGRRFYPERLVLAHHLASAPVVPPRAPCPPAPMVDTDNPVDLARLAALPAIRAAIAKREQGE